MAEPLTTESSEEVADAFDKIYKRVSLVYPKLLKIDPGGEFMGAVSTLMARHKTTIRRGRVETHRDQGTVERWNRTLAERFFGCQYSQEHLIAARVSPARSAESVARLPAAVAWLRSTMRLPG